MTLCSTRRLFNRTNFAVVEVCALLSAILVRYDAVAAARFVVTSGGGCTVDTVCLYVCLSVCERNNSMISMSGARNATDLEEIFWIESC